MEDTEIAVESIETEAAPTPAEPKAERDKLGHLSDSTWEKIVKKVGADTGIEPAGDPETETAEDPAAVTEETPTAEPEKLPEEPKLTPQQLRLAREQKKLNETKAQIETQRAELEQGRAQVQDWQNRVAFMREHLYDNPDEALKAVGLSVDFLVNAIQNRQVETETDRLKREFEEFKRQTAERTEQDRAREQASANNKHLEIVAHRINDELSKPEYGNINHDPKAFAQEVWEEIHRLAPGHQGAPEQLFSIAAKRVNKLHAGETPTPAKKPVGSSVISQKEPPGSLMKPPTGKKKMSPNEAFDAWAKAKGLE